jgi:hypothetical protein
MMSLPAARARARIGSAALSRTSRRVSPLAGMERSRSSRTYEFERFRETMAPAGVQVSWRCFRV